MDQIFDRLGRLFKSLADIDPFAPAGGDQGRQARPGARRSTGDSDLDDAMAELDDFLDPDRMAAEARERERREREERERSRRPSPATAAADRRLQEAYRTLGLPFGTPYPAVKSAYKKLLREHHPDRNGGTPLKLRAATELSARINAAFQLIETWTETGKVPAE